MSSEATPAPAAEAVPSDDGEALRTAGFVLGGVGAVGAIGFAATAIMIVRADDVATEHCDPTCDQEGNDADARGAVLLPINAAMLAVGGVGLAAGATLLILSEYELGSEEAAANVRVRASVGRVVVDGRF